MKSQKWQMAPSDRKAGSDKVEEEYCRIETVQKANEISLKENLMW